MNFFFTLLFLTSPLIADHVPIDRTLRSFETKRPLKHRVDIFDFSGEFLELENIDIDARRKKNVELRLTGEYPLLEKVNYEGSFGTLVGDLTGIFPKLTHINLLCTSCCMNLNLNSQWSRSCEINIRGANEDITVKLPENVGLIIHTRTAPKGKVIPNNTLFKERKWSFLNKTYKNALAETAPIVLKINIEAGEGRIILN